MAEAAVDLELLDYDFHLFTEKATGVDSVIYRTPDGYQLAQARPPPHPPVPADAPITISEHPVPKLAGQEGVARLEALDQPFLFFADSQTSRGNVIYHRYNGHYGLITPAAAPSAPNSPNGGNRPASRAPCGQLPRSDTRRCDARCAQPGTG